VEGITARNLSLDLGGVESPLISQQASDLITPSPMSIVATPRAPHKYFDQGDAEAGGAGADQKGASWASSSGTKSGLLFGSSKHETAAPSAWAEASPVKNSSQVAELPSSQAKTPRAPKRSLFEAADREEGSSSSP